MSNSLNDPVICISYLHAKKEYRDALIQSLFDLVRPTLAEPGCLQYEILQDNEDSNCVILLSKFINLKALDEHEEQPYIIRFLNEYMNQYCEKVTWNVAKEIKQGLL